ncbi:MAG: hypothetical protein FJW34_20630, partial [Acidobacteria bacterium]|nr:hypothetical protein [Acidobacteriota bacterium]
MLPRRHRDLAGAWLGVWLGAAAVDAQFVARPELLRDLAPAHSGVVFTQLPVGTPAEKQAEGMLRARYGECARLVLLSPEGTMRVLSEGFHSAADPEVSFDGQRLLFAGKRTAAEEWNIFEMDLAGGAPRQITRGMGDCR